MKSITINIYHSIGVLLVFFLLNACNVDDFLDEPPLNEYSESSVFQTETDMIIASNHLYTFLFDLHPTSGGARLWIWTDDGWRRNGNNGSTLTWLASDGEKGEFLDFYAYENIRHCNEFISRIDDVEFTTEGLAERLEAETRFIRAFLYEKMVFFYGDVSLVTEPQNLDDFPERTPRKEVFDFVISELDAVANILPANYTSGDEGRITKWAALAMKSRACLHAVGWHPNPATLYDNAEVACKTILDEGGFNLDQGVDGFKRLFTHHSDVVTGSKPSDAVILSSNYIDVVRVADRWTNRCFPRGAYQGPDGGNNVAMFGATQNLVSSFQTIKGLAPADDPDYDPTALWVDMDPRLRASLIMPRDVLPALGGQNRETYIFSPHPKQKVFNNDRADRNQGMDTGYLIRKYTGLSIEGDIKLEYTNNKTAHADYKQIRLAEVILMMAEVLAADNNPQSLDYVNMVRNRVGMPGYNSIGDVPTGLINGTTGNALIDAVLLERRYEFVGEAPYRMADIWRYRLGDQVYGEVEGFPNDPDLPGDLSGDNSTYANTTRVWDDKYYLFPLPQSALDVNPNLGSNNPGW